MASRETGRLAGRKSERLFEPAPSVEARTDRALVIASDSSRAALVVAGLGALPVHIEIVGDRFPGLGELPVPAVSVMIVATPETDIPLLTQLLAVPGLGSIPTIAFVDRTTRALTTQVLQLGVSAFIVDGLEPERVPSILSVAMERHAMTTVLQEQLRKSRDDLAARKTIERAKGVIMTKGGLSEQEAYDSLRRLAMSQGKPLREIAETVLSVITLFP